MCTMDHDGIGCNSLAQESQSVLALIVRLSSGFADKLASVACIIEPMSDWELPSQQHDECTNPWEEKGPVRCA